MGLRGTSLALAAGLLAVGLLAASPYLSRNLVGTGEAYNYSFSVADAVIQMRHGVVPPLAGQTQYAFNGRIHPLRNAPYLYYLAGAIDAVTLHRLEFWQIQNVSVALSLVALAFTCYWGLRWGTGCPRLPAFLLAALYGLSAPVLAAAHQLDLFMTVHAAVFVPLAIGACMRGLRAPSFSVDAWLAAAMAATWLAHPPVALWLSMCVVLVRLLGFLRRPSWRILLNGVGAVVLGLALASFVFASVGTLNADLGYFTAAPGLWLAFADVIMGSLRDVFPAVLRPVSRGGGLGGDLQFGYVPWALLALTLLAVLRRPRAADPTAREDRFGARASCLVTLLLLILVLPVPLVTRWLWQHLPGTVLSLTTQWPMQRLYLVGVAFTVFGAGMALPRRWSGLGRGRWAAGIAILLAGAWTVYEAVPFIRRGFESTSDPVATRYLYAGSNLDLTVTSYAFLGLPPTFNHGVMDPSLEFRVLRAGTDEIDSNLAEGVAKSPVVLRGSLRMGSDAATARIAASGTLVLKPWHLYLLTFDFKTAPVPGAIVMIGASLSRTYQLPSGGEAKGFGMLDGERRTLPVWTSTDKPETVEFRFVQAGGRPILPKGGDFADFTLQDVNRSRLPVDLQSFLPMRFTVNSPEAGCMIETPRRYISGYEAQVDGRSVVPLMSPTRQVMVPVPKGRSVVTLSYVGPPLAREAFWFCALCWAGFLAWRLTGSRDWSLPVVAGSRELARVPGLMGRHKLATVAVIFVGVAAAVVLQRRNEARAFLHAVGPICIDFELPFGKGNQNQPLLQTGKAGAAVIVFIAQVDASHVRLGADVWGKLYQSDLIEVDPGRLQTLVVSDSALFPKDNPRFKALDPTEQERLRGELTVELNGKVAIKDTWYGYETTRSEIHTGETPIGSLTIPKFLGRILSVARLPIPRTITVPRGRHARMEVLFPAGRERRSEPLLSVACASGQMTVSATYLGPGRLTLSTRGSDGIVTTSAPIAYDPLRDHVIEFFPEATPNRGTYFDVACVFDGAAVLGQPGAVAPASPCLMQSGRDAYASPGVDVRFTGSAMDLVDGPDAPGGAAPEAWGPLDLVVTFPAGRTGHADPLLTSGRAGAGDFIYAAYVDPQHVRIGIDHWGGAGAISDPIAIDYTIPHEVLIRAGALYPDPSDAAAWGGVSASARADLATHVVIALDGKTILSAPVATHPCPQNEVTVAKNTIGGSTAGPDFTGTVHFEERTGLSAKPPGL